MDDSRREPDSPMFEGDDLLEPPGWPKVVGTISIVWASLGLTCGACGLIMPIVTTSMVKGVEQQWGPMPDVMKPTALQMAIGAFGMIPTILLLVGGIMVVARKPAGGLVHVIYGVLSLITTVAGVIVGLQQQRAIADWVQQNPDNQWAQQAKPGVGLAIMGVMLTLGLVWPIFSIIWFGAVKRGAPMDIPREEII